MNPGACQPLGEILCARLAVEIHQLGFPVEPPLPVPIYEEADFSLSRDPYSGQESLVGIWRDSTGRRLGEIKFHGDGSFYAEYDVLLPHPRDARWFVEAVVGWGRDGVVKSEAKLVLALE